MKTSVCPKLLTVTATIAVLVSVAREQNTVISEKELGGYFESIVCEDTNIVFTTRKEGMKFIYSVDGSEDKVSGYGETINLPFNSALKLFDYNHSMTIMPMPDAEKRKGFCISLKKDFRSMRGGVTTNYAYLVATGEKADTSDEKKGSSNTNTVSNTKSATSMKAGVPGRRVFKGLKLLPCD